MQTLKAIWALITALWKTGNRLARVAIACFLIWPLAIIGIGLLGIPWLTALVSLVPLIGMASCLFLTFDPLILAVIAAFNQGRKILRTIAFLVAIELLVGIYFSLVPVRNDRGLVPLFILVILAIIFLSVGIQGKLVKSAISILSFIAVAITIIFMVGGRQSLGSWSIKGNSIVAESPAEEFSLAVGKDIPTVWSGPGIHYKIWGNKPYIMNRVLSDGSIIPYEMPAGWETLTGVEPAGRVRLMAKVEGTVVKIVRE